MVDRRTFLAGTAAAGLAALAGCSGPLRPTVKVAVPWSGTELEAFRAVLRGLEPLDYRTVPVPLGDDVATVFGQHPANRPDVVLVPQPGLVDVNRGQLASLPEPANWPYGDLWHPMLVRDGRLYGIPFKITHKSVVWYRRSVLEQCGLSEPRLWSEWLEVNESLASCGIAPLAVAGADGWAVTDFFENVLAGYAPDAYRMLSSGSASLHEPPQVRTALARLGEMWAADGALYGGVAGSLTRQFADAVVQVFVHRRAAMVVAPDFAELVIREFVDDTSDVGVFLFPAIDDAGLAPATRPLVVGGDVAVVVSKDDTANAHDLVNRLAATNAPDRWITEFGGFLAANQDARPPYSEQLCGLASDIRQADERGAGNVQFDLSDRLGAIGGSGGLGRALQDFLERVGGRGAGVDVDREAARVVDELAGMEG